MNIIDNEMLSFEFTLKAGDSICYAGDCVHAVVNPGRTPCSYYLAMDVLGDKQSATHSPSRARKGVSSR